MRVLSECVSAKFGEITSRSIASKSLRFIVACVLSECVFFCEIFGKLLLEV